MSAALSRRLVSVLALALTALAACWAPSAGAAYGLQPPDVYFANPDGTPANLAGSHPDSMATTIEFNTAISEGKESPEQAVKDLEAQLPLGLAGIPAATERCSGADFADLDEKALPQPLPNCSNDSVVGYVKVGAHFAPVPIGGVESGAAVLYNLEPAPGTVAKFGFVYLKVPVTIEIKVSETAPYRVIAILRNTAQPILIYSSTLTVWGVPASATHDAYRGTCFGGVELDGTLISQGNCPVSEDAPQLPLLTAPRACEGPLTTLFSTDSWEVPGVFATASTVTHDDEVPPQPLGFEGCDELDFEPEISAAPSTQSAETPAGLDFDVEMDDEGISSPTGRAQSDVKRIVARLPEGVTLNTGAADGLQGCTTAQFESEKLTTPPNAGCPQASKVGSIAVKSPLVEEELQGAIFVAQPDDPATSTPGQENPFDSFLAVYMVFRNQNLGVIIKQAGKVEADPVSGRLVTVFDDVPQLPFGRLRAHFREGPRAPLVTPGKCGTFVAEADQTPWADPENPLTTVADFQIASGPGGGPCPGPTGPLAPGLSAGTADNTAGSHSPFNLRLTRNPGEAEFTRISATLAPGLTGTLAGIARCSDAALAGAAAKTGLQELASPSCPATSQVGEVLAGAGAGSSLTYVPGRAYLASAYLGAPFSIAVITPAVAGPFDAGNVVVRLPLRVDPNTAQVTVDGSSAPPLPRILKGIPLRLRDLRVSINRPNFTLNPTSCEPSSILTSVAGAGPQLSSGTETIAQLATHFQASNCGKLGFKPKLAFSLTGSTKRAGHPVLRTELKERSGDANLGRVAAILPRSQFIDPERVANPCTREQYANNACPPESVLGRARAFTPLLDNPLEGPVYFRSNGGARDLPDIVADLNGEVHFTLVGFVDAVTKKGSEISRVRTIFQTPPDAPVSKFVLSLKGGKEGVLQNSENLCARVQKVTLKLRGQNGKIKKSEQKIKTRCGKKKNKDKKKR